MRYAPSWVEDGLPRIGRYRIRRGDFRRAIEEMERALDMAPPDWWLRKTAVPALEHARRQAR